MNKLASNKEKFIQRVKNFDFEVALTKLVPCNSPSDEYFREVISYLVSKNFKSELDFFSNCKKHSSIDEDEMYKIKELIRKQKKCTDLPVTYLLSILLSKYPSAENSNEWRFLGCLLLILLLNTQYNADNDSPDSNNTKKKKTRIQETCPHIRISLENTSSKYIIEFLINEHKKVKNLADLFNLYNKIKNFNNNISHTQINNTRISAIRLYPVSTYWTI